MASESQPDAACREKGHFRADQPDEIADNRNARSASPPIGRSSVAEHISRYVKRFEQQLVEYNLEARGIQRVDENERIRLSWVSYLQVFLLWSSINLAANNITLGMLGPAVYALSFLDSSLCSVFGAFVGSLVAAWSATWGPVSGNRTMVSRRSGSRPTAEVSNFLPGVRPLCHGLVDEQTYCDTEPHPNDRILSD